MFSRDRQLTRRSAGAEGAAHHGAEPHVWPIKVYIAVFVSLLFLTVVTVGVSLLGLPPVPSIIAAILVALVKAIIVAAFFMHLISEDRFYSVILVCSVFFIVLFFVLTLLDMDARGTKNYEETNHYWNEFNHNLTN
jgi:cytochrome c oxidase subunit 4